MLLWVMGVRFNNTRAVSGEWNVSRVISRLYGWVYKTLRLSTLVVEHSVVVMRARLNPMSTQFLILVLWNLSSESVGGIKFWDPVEDSDTGGPRSVTVRMEHVFAFQYWYSELCVENRWGAGRKHCFVDFSSLVALESSVDEGWWGGAESYIQGQLKSHLFPAEILVEAINMKHSGILYPLDISVFCFCESLLFQIFVPREFIKP